MFNPLLPGHFKTNYLSSSEVESLTENNDERIQGEHVFLSMSDIWLL